MTPARFIQAALLCVAFAAISFGATVSDRASCAWERGIGGDVEPVASVSLARLSSGDFSLVLHMTHSADGAIAAAAGILRDVVGADAPARICDVSLTTPSGTSGTTIVAVTTTDGSRRRQHAALVAMALRGAGQSSALVRFGVSAVFVTLRPEVVALRRQRDRVMGALNGNSTTSAAATTTTMAPTTDAATSTTAAGETTTTGVGPQTTTTAAATGTTTSTAPDTTNSSMATTTTMAPTETPTSESNTTVSPPPETSTTATPPPATSNGTGAPMSTTTTAATTSPPTTAAAAPSTTTTVAPTPAPTTTAAPQPLIFTLTFASDAEARAFAAQLAARFGIPIGDIDILDAANGTVKFRFLGASAGALSQQFNDTPASVLRTDFGITAKESQPAPSDDAPADEDNTTRLILFIVVPIAGVIVIVGAVVFIRHKVNGGGASGRVGFQEYVAMQQQSQSGGSAPGSGPQSPAPQRRGVNGTEGGADEMDKLL